VNPGDQGNNAEIAEFSEGAEQHRQLSVRPADHLSDLRELRDLGGQWSRATPTNLWNQAGNKWPHHLPTKHGTCRAHGVPGNYPAFPVTPNSRREAVQHHFPLRPVLEFQRGRHHIVRDRREAGGWQIRPPGIGDPDLGNPGH
jgi:hypothetical protein